MMNHSLKPFGIIPAIPSLFNEKEGITIEDLKNVIEFVINNGSHGIALLLIGGEYYKLSEDERMQVIKSSIDIVKSSVPVYVGLSSLSITQVLKFSKIAKDYGIECGVISIPYTDPLGILDHDTIIRYLSEILSKLEKLDFNVILQDSIIGNIKPLGADNILYLLNNFNNIVGFKVEGRNSLRRMRDIITLTENKVSILGGWLGINLLHELSIGASGNIPGSALSDYLTKIYNLYMHSNIEEAKALFNRIFKLLKIETEYMRSFYCIEKMILKARGIISSSYCREPSPVVTKRALNLIYSYLKELTNLPNIL